MKGFIQKIKDIWNHDELRHKIGYTLLLLLIYRVGSFIVLPGVDSAKLDAGAQGGLLGFLGLFTGGAFSRVSIFATRSNALHFSIHNHSIIGIGSTFYPENAERR